MAHGISIVLTDVYTLALTRAPEGMLAVPKPLDEARTARISCQVVGSDDSSRKYVRQAETLDCHDF